MKYVHIEPHLFIYKYYNENEPTYFLQTPNADWQQKSNKGTSFEINSIASEILLQFNGSKTYEQIIEYLKKKYDELPESIDKKIQLFLNTLNTNCPIEVRTSSKEQTNLVELIEYNGIYPTVVSIEMTSRCNIMCKHCYGFFGECKVQDIPYDKLKPLFKNLATAGVITVELTGGDPSTYKYIAEAIEIAISSGIKSVMLLTNGIVVSKQLVAILEKYKESVFIQIDLHSLNSDYYDWFTNSKNNLIKVKTNIDLLISKGVPVRVVTIVTQKNLNEIELLADWAYNHGAIAFAASTVVPMGRANGASMEDSLFLPTEESFLGFVDIYKKIDKKYPGFIRIISEERYSSEACGALISNASIKSNGDLKICTMDTGDDFKLNLGNVFHEDFTDIYNRNQIFLNKFSKMTLPNALTICKDCNNALYCNRCVVRGMQKASEMRDDCTWYKNYLPKELKKKLVNMS